MSRVELLSAGGLRLDNRRPYELRQLDFSILANPPVGCDAAASVAHGLTKVLAFVSGPHDSSESARVPGGAGGGATTATGAISVHITTTPFSGLDRKRVGKSDKKLADLAQAIENTFAPVVMLQLYPRSTIDVFIEILEQDGALLQAAVNVTTLALVAAGISITDYVVAVSVAALANPSCPLLDLSNTEQTDLPNLTLAALPRTQKLTLLQLDTRINIDTFDSLLRIALEACLVLQREIDGEVRRWSGLLNTSMRTALDYKAGPLDGPVARDNAQLLKDEEMSLAY